MSWTLIKEVTRQLYSHILELTVTRRVPNTLNFLHAKLPTHNSERSKVIISAGLNFQDIHLFIVMHLNIQTQYHSNVLLKDLNDLHSKKQLDYLSMLSIIVPHNQINGN